MQSHLVEMLVDHVIPFRFTESLTFRAFAESLRPGSSRYLPAPTQVRGKLLQKEANAANENMEENLRNKVTNGVLVGIVVDSWTNVKKENVEAVCLVLGDESFLYDSFCLGSAHHGVAVAKFWTEILDDVTNTLLEQIGMIEHSSSIPISYFLSDNAGQCARARCILARCQSNIKFLCCWAHQINLMVRAVLDLGEFKQVLNQACKAANTILASSSKWYLRLKDKCNEMYGKAAPCTIQSIGETRWNSTQSCFTSMLRIRGACEVFVATYKNNKGFPKELLIWSNEFFWANMVEAELLIRPFCDASHVMQRSSNTMAHVVLVILNLYNDISYAYNRSKMEVDIVTGDIKSWWNTMEQPLFFLGFCLHPQYRLLGSAILLHSRQQNGSWSSKRNKLTVSRLVSAAKFYWVRFAIASKGFHGGWHFDSHSFNHEELTMELGAHLKKWLMGDPMSGLDPWNNTKDVLEWWQMQREEFPTLSLFATFLLCAPVQGATVERVFKDFSSFHTKKRNNMKTTTKRMLKLWH